MRSHTTISDWSPTVQGNIKRLIDEVQCYQTVRELRWPDGVACPACASQHVIKRGCDDTASARQRYACHDCDTRFAQFLAVCRSIKTACTCENLPFTEPVSPPQEILSHAGALPFAPTLQRRTVPRVHPYAPVERSPTAMSSLPEPPHWTVGHIPISTRVQALLVP